MIARYIIPLLCIWVTFIASANNETDIKKHDGHYYLLSEINGHSNQEIMLESAIPGLLIGDSIFSELFPEFDYNGGRKMENAKIALHQNLYSIDYILDKDVEIGYGTYDGKVFILKDYKGIALPLQNYTSNNKTNQFIYIDLQSGIFKFTDSIDQSITQRFKYQIIDGIPVVYTNLEIKTDTISTSVDSDFIVDFGNAALLFLMKNNDAIREMLENSKVSLSVAKNKEGKVIAEGLYAEELTIGDFRFSDVSVGVTTKLKSFDKFAGMIGLKFFQTPFIIDPMNHELIMLSCD